MEYLSLFFGIISLDQFTKKLADKKIKPGEEVEVCKGVFHLTNVKNKGAIYGVMQENPKKLLYLSLLIHKMFLDYLYFFKREYGINKGIKFSLAMLFGGGISNLLDRTFAGEVTDFIRIKKYKKFPIFNIADIFVLIGAISCLVSLLIQFRNSRK